MAEEIIQIDVNSLNPNPLQPRGSITPESLVDLIDSINEGNPVIDVDSSIG